jgi:hypothetical protein
MRFKAPKNNERFLWTNHAAGKMIFYGLSEQRVKRAILNPNRTEEGIAPDTLACMQIGGSKKHRQEIWVMYQKIKSPLKTSPSLAEKLKTKSSKLKIISTWRYPGKSPAKNPIPREILDEIKDLI